MARELVHDANMKMAYYANLRKQDFDNFPIGTSVRISLDGVEFNKFRQRPSMDGDGYCDGNVMGRGGVVDLASYSYLQVRSYVGQKY